MFRCVSANSPDGEGWTKPLSARAKLSFTKMYGQMNGLLEGWRQMYVALHTINYRFSFTKTREKWEVKEKAESCAFIHTLSFAVHFLFEPSGHK